MSQHIVIIGGGVIGTACAHYLTEAGCRVTVLDKGTIGGGCSHGNCGYIAPSHVLPLTEPGAVRRAWKSLFQKDAPFKVRLRLDFGLMYWFWQFARRCNYQDMLRAAPAIQSLLLSSMTRYEQLVQAGLDAEWQKRGLLYVYRSRERWEAFAQTNVLLRDQFNEPARPIEPDELETMEPALKAGLAGAWYYEHDAHLRPDRLMRSWKQRLEQRGVQFREQCEVTGFVSNGRTVRAVRTRTGDIPCDGSVAALGAWSPFLQHELGCRIPIQPGKGYSITMPRPARCPTYPIIFPETRVAVTPWASGYRLGSTMEFAGYDATLRPERLELLRRGSRDYLHEPYCEPVLEEWYGWRPMTWDSLPIIDRTPRYDNVFLATGHNMLGMSMAPGTGQLVAELVTGATPHIDPRPYSVQRF